MGMLKSEDVEIRTQVHLMDAEGCHDEKPTKQEIIQYLESKGFSPSSDIEIWLDSMQSLWRWICNIKTNNMNREIKLKAWDSDKQCFVPQGEICFRDYGETSWKVYPNDESYVGDKCHNGEEQRGRFHIIRSANILDEHLSELWEGDLREIKGKLYKVVDDGWRFRFERNMFEFGENHDIVVDEDTAYESTLKGNIYETSHLISSTKL
jgi:hypothetical protein